MCRSEENNNHHSVSLVLSYSLRGNSDIPVRFLLDNPQRYVCQDLVFHHWPPPFSFLFTPAGSDTLFSLPATPEVPSVTLKSAEDLQLLE